MVKKRTAAQHEAHLNALYADAYSESQAVNAFIYMTSKQRKVGNRTTVNNIRNCHANGKLGTLLRRYDSIAFEVSKSDR